MHEFYRYPARFSPTFARAAIEAFSDSGDVVLDPFVGGGTTLVEARLMGRIAIGSDINTLAVFVSRAKTRAYTQESCDDVELWAEALDDMRVTDTPWSQPNMDTAQGRNLNTPQTSRLKTMLGLALDRIPQLTTPHGQLLARCAVLRTGQWALDMREGTPTVPEFRRQLVSTAKAMADVARLHGSNIREADRVAPRSERGPRTIIANRSAQSLARGTHAPRLILTSPPYPGVYVNYHRWKVNGRKETGAPFWITGSSDGHGIAHYTMGARADASGERYFATLQQAWSNIARLADESTRVVQLVGFGDADSQLARYLRVMKDAGFHEEIITEIANHSDGRLWRSVPGRRWWVKADSRTSSAPSTAREVVLIHRPKR